jgi:L-sorbose 1-phosphate reductase
MKTQGVRLYGKKDLRLESFELPTPTAEEIQAHIISDSICMSSYKAASQGSDHKRVPNNIATAPIIIGHEFCGEITKVGEKWKGQFEVGQKFAIQPALNYKGTLDAPGYSYNYIGGDAQDVIIPNEVMEMNCLLPYAGEAFYLGSLAEPMSCIVGAYHANYHTKGGSYKHEMGIVKGGNIAILAGAGPMGLGAVDYAVHCDRKPSLIVVTDIDDARLARAASIYTPEAAAKEGVKLLYVNTGNKEDAQAYLMSLTNNEGYNDVFVYAPVKPVVELADRILAKDGCLNFFAGPTDPTFSANFNFYNVHYASTHVVGTSGGNTDDMIESLAMMSSGKLNPSSMITHVGGLDAVVNTTLNLPSITGGKKLIYNNIKMDLTALVDLEAKGATHPVFKDLAAIVKSHNGLWSVEAEKYLLAKAPKL